MTIFTISSLATDGFMSGERFEDSVHHIIVVLLSLIVNVIPARLSESRKSSPVRHKLKAGPL